MMGYTTMNFRFHFEYVLRYVNNGIFDNIEKTAAPSIQKVEMSYGIVQLIYSNIAMK